MVVEDNDYEDSNEVEDEELESEDVEARELYEMYQNARMDVVEDERPETYTKLYDLATGEVVSIQTEEIQREISELRERSKKAPIKTRDFIKRQIKRLEVKLKNVEYSVGVGGINVLVKKEYSPNHSLVMSQKRFFPAKLRYKDKITGMTEEKPRRNPFYNPLKNKWEDRRVQNYLVDLSLTKDVYGAYVRYSERAPPTFDMRDKVVLLLGIIQQSYPPTAIGEVIGMTPYTASRIVSTLSGDGLVGSLKISRRESVPRGRTLEFPKGSGDLYREGPLLESYKVLTTRGKDYYRSLLRQLSVQSKLSEGGSQAIPYKGEIAARAVEYPKIVELPRVNGGVMNLPQEKAVGPMDVFVFEDGEVRAGREGKVERLVDTIAEREREVEAGGQILTREEAEYFIINKGLTVFGDEKDINKRLRLLREYKKRFPENMKDYHWIWRTAPSESQPQGIEVTYVGPYPQSWLPVAMQGRELATPGKPKVEAKVKWTRDEAKGVGDRLGLGGVGYKSMVWKELVKPPMGGGKLTDSFRLRQIGVDLEEFRMGLEAESEHADVTGGNAIMTALIALAHLREMPDYYTRLRKMEK